MMRDFFTSVFVLLAAASPAAAQIITWDANGANPPNGTFSEANNWDLNQVPIAGNTARFNIANTYNVTFGPNAVSDSVQVLAGTVSFRSSSATVRTYDLLTGGADLVVGGGTLNVGAPAAPIDLTVGDRLNIGDVAASGTVIVSGTGSRLDATGAATNSIGANGQIGTLTFESFAEGTINATLNLGVSRNNASQGNLNVFSGADLTTASLNVATFTSLATGNVTVDGSRLIQSGASSLTLGSASGGAGTLTISNGGEFNSGTGTTTVNATGLIDVGGIEGLFNANGPIIIDGGTLMRADDSLTAADFNLASGLTLTATNNGQVTFVGGYRIDDGTTFDINSGADFLLTRDLRIGFSSDGTLLVDGAGSSVTTGSDTSFWGRSGNTADATFRNAATGGLGTIRLADGGGTGTTGILNVESGATVTAGNLHVATFAASGDATATITVTGAGSSLTQNGASTLTVGASGASTATINVTNSGIFTTGTGLTTIDTTGTLNVNTGGTFDALGNIELAGTINLAGGTLSAVDINVTGSTFNFPFGTLEVNSNQSLDAARLAILNVATLLAGKTFRVGGTATLLTPLVLAGGTFGADSLVNPFLLDFQTGTFELTGDNLVVGPAGLFGSSLALASGQTISVANAATVDADGLLWLEGGSFGAVAGTTNNGEIQLGGTTAQLSGGTVTNSGLIHGNGRIGATLNNSTAGELRVLSGQRIVVEGTGSTNSGEINLLGGFVEIDQPFVNNAAGQITGRGTLDFAGRLDNQGAMQFSGGFTDVFGNVSLNAAGEITIAGGSTTTFYGNVDHNGNEIRTSGTSISVFFGNVTGTGNFTGTGTVEFHGDVFPGNSPAEILLAGDVILAAAQVSKSSWPAPHLAASSIGWLLPATQPLAARSTWCF